MNDALVLYGRCIVPALAGAMQKGVVQLSSFVSSNANIDKAVEIARGVKGVTSVRNSMRLK
jgi:osmotically-inducible protein OsmY